ncbi:MAG: hypothetical protein OEW21_04695 [Betaproteobacteria bacterium]|nr:hypothetical protein [Betaproteobacteria bacterium]
MTENSRFRPEEIAGIAIIAIGRRGLRPHNALPLIQPITAVIVESGGFGHRVVPKPYPPLHRGGFYSVHCRDTRQQNHRKTC